MGSVMLYGAGYRFSMVKGNVLFVIVHERIFFKRAVGMVYRYSLNDCINRE
jgi:hypothetical protein